MDPLFVKRQDPFADHVTMLWTSIPSPHRNPKKFAAFLRRCINALCCIEEKQHRAHVDEASACCALAPLEQSKTGFAARVDIKTSIRIEAVFGGLSG